jgi:hypothetical protein
MTLAYGAQIQSANNHIEQLAADLYEEYEPTRPPGPSFLQRLEAWVDNVAEDDEQRTLFEFVPHLFFIGPREMEILYRVAYNVNIARWLIEQISLPLDAADADVRLKAAISQTWFCPITDSMRINWFYHLNHIAGFDYRPDWRSLSHFGSTDKIKGYLRTNHIKRVVLVEDFVGSGSQMQDAVQFAASLQIPALVTPLIICPDGERIGESLPSLYTHISFSPVLSLPDSLFIRPLPFAGEPTLYPRIRDLALRRYDRLKCGLQPDEIAKLYGPFGFRDTGGVVVMYTNCPDNTLPLIHHTSGGWSPLFPRASRL